MNLSSFFKKTFLIASLFLVGINPVFAEVTSDSSFGIDVTSTLTYTIEATSTSEAQAEATTTPSRPLIAEPTIRVGLYKTSEAIKFTSDFNYEVWIAGVLQGLVMPGETAELSYSKGFYTIKSPGLESSSTDYIRLVPQDPSSFFTLVNYNRPVAGRKKINFNAYRGTLEYRFSPKSNLPYIINELPLDTYVKGIAEVHDSAPSEYLKALSVAARSYAHALIGKTPPTEKRMFDVYATTRDQLYLGYNSELFMLKFVAAATATAGELVTYKGDPVITFYFSRSNGSTKSGGKNRPWLKPVVASYDKGKKMLGHGIGMSNQDAIARASKDSWDYKQLLGHYYSDTLVEKVF